MTTDVRNRLDEKTAHMWSDSELKGWIVEGSMDISRRALCLETYSPSAMVVTAGTQTYNAPADVIQIYRIEFVPSGSSIKYPLDYRDFTSMDVVWGPYQATTQGTPINWTSWSSPPSITVTLYPTPSQNGSLNLLYYRLAKDIATDGSQDSTNLDVPEGWWDAAAQYAVSIAMRKDSDPRWQDERTIYEGTLTALIDATRRVTDQSDSINPMVRPFATNAWWIYDTEW